MPFIAAPLKGVGVATSFVFERLEGGGNVSFAIIQCLGERNGILKGNARPRADRGMYGFQGITNQNDIVVVPFLAGDEFRIEPKRSV